jgi:catechol 2,3-dioxygenase-like lactoylglutathione lyase family enzyme
MAGLGDYPAAAVLRAQDLARAKKFYTEVLGLKPMSVPGPPSDDIGMFTAGDGTMIMVYERPGMPAPQNTAVGFGLPADKFDEVVADLRGRGVTFEDYDLPEIGLKTVGGIAEYEGGKAAWFKDSEDNIVNIATM